MTQPRKVDLRAFNAVCHIVALVFSVVALAFNCVALNYNLEAHATMRHVEGMRGGGK